MASQSHDEQSGSSVTIVNQLTHMYTSNVINKAEEKSLQDVKLPNPDCRIATSPTNVVTLAKSSRPAVP